MQRLISAAFDAVRRGFLIIFIGEAVFAASEAEPQRTRLDHGRRGPGLDTPCLRFSIDLVPFLGDDTEICPQPSPSTNMSIQGYSRHTEEWR